VNGSLPAWLDDRLVGPDGLTVSALDAGLRSGWGVFETLRAHGRSTLAVERHLARLEQGARRLGIATDVDHVRSALSATLAAPRDVAEVAVRITLTAGPVAGPVAAATGLEMGVPGWPPAPVGRPTLVITLHPAPLLPLPPARAVTTSARRWPADVKTTSYVASVLATQEARAAGADVAVLVDGDELLETAEGNLFMLLDGRLVTPPADGRILAGVTRELALEAAETIGVRTRVAPLRRHDVARAEALFVTSSVAGVRTIVRLDDVDVPARDATGEGSTVGVTESWIVTALREALERQRD